MMVDFDAEDFKKRFPNLYREIVSKRMRMRMDAIRNSEERAEEVESLLKGGLPGPVDYIRRCDTDEEALEVIEYLESRGEAERLREQVIKNGVRSFGPKKELGYYSRFLV